MWSFDKFRENTALQDEYGNCITYDALDTACKDFRAVNSRRCLVAILCKNMIGSIIGYIAAVNNGIVPMLLSADLDADLLAELLELYKPSYIWMPDEKKAEYDRGKEVFSRWDYSLIMTDYDKEYPLHEELCLLLTTSGSTGSPKFVRQSYGNVRSNALAIVSYLNITADERPITTLPMNYTYGLSIINSHLFVGATILVTDKGLMQKEFWGFFKSAGATSFGGVPYTYEMLDRLRFQRMDLPSLRYMTQAGGKLSEDLQSRFAEVAEAQGKRFIVMYGQCEATARMGYLPPEYAIRKKGSMGVAIPGGKFRISDPDGQIITKPHTPGELIYEGDNVTMGYAQKGSDLILGDERKGILHTGDIAEFDEDGFYYIIGRMKRFLKIFGNRVNLDEIERLIKHRFPSEEVACAGVDDHMYIFITNPSIADELKTFVALKTGLNQSAFRTKVLDSIPKNDSGKILYRELDKYYDV
ncbi:Acyl-CoA synthetase (AMP-forming)/AMP-acid ligase II [Ruminococcaceae bacterium KH2T8]|nr:Acyl-CoA synthetase (AMP-forming)/AMP-acid ligase II [Ruminococcaceae bacterium KH2T8]